MTAPCATPTRALPVLIVAHRRPKTFDLTLRSLLRVEGVSPANVYVVQDGALAAVKTSARTHGIAERNFHQRAGPRGAVAKEKRIATHYKYALEWIFAHVAADVPGVIVVEDDLLFAPDWMRYFRAVAPLLESDETLISASAWNDNAFVHNIDRVAGASELRRTTNFPGLSWLLPRALWTTQLSASWPAEHLDHWMRDATTHRGRETLCPAISRVWHHGAHGANVSPELQATYFDPVALALDAAPWSAVDVAAAARAPYEARLEALLSGAKHSGAGFAATLAALLDDARIDGTAVTFGLPVLPSISLNTGTLSQEIILSSMEALPQTIIPSIGIAFPWFTITISPISKSVIRHSTKVPSTSFTAFLICNFCSESKAVVV